MTLQNPSLLFALATLVACGGNVGTTKDDDDTGSVTDDTADTAAETGDTAADTSDSGNDTGSDTADTGSDTSDTGTDTAAPWNGITGDIQYRSDVDGEVLCDADIAFSGTPYTGDCADCTFGFNIDASVTEDRGTSDCELNPLLSYVPSGSVSNLAMLYWDVYEYSGYYGSATYYGLWGTAFEYSYYGYAYPDTQYIGADGYGNEMIVDGADISWSVIDSATDYIYETPYGADCSTTASSGADPSAPVTGGESASEDLDTTVGTLDAWTVTTDGLTDLVITVDTVNLATAFDPAFTVYDESECYATSADDVFDCTYTYAYQCPGATFTAPAAGTWTVLVDAYSAADATAEYTLAVTGGTGLTLVGDDVTNDAYIVGSSTTTLTVTGTGTLHR